MADTRPRDTSAILSLLTLEEKVSLLAATDWWRTPAIDRPEVFVPQIKTTDGPNGARGESYVSGIKAACFPCGTSTGATFDKELLHNIGVHIAKEAKTKSADILLAPTLNVIRHPLGGRNYETYSEDPVVLGKLAAAFVRGCQSQGVPATPKHFVANEAENERKTLSVEVDEQTLREVYLLPFQLVLKESEPWCFMTSYNRVNGRYVADDYRLVTEVLREEWGFNGLVMSDWMGVYSTAQCINAGVDLEMPGPPKWRGKALVDAVRDGQVKEAVIDESARRVIDMAKFLGKFERPDEPPERAVDDPERDEFIATAGAEGMVLLKNTGGILPINRKSKVAIIGHHATHVSLGGGGSARVDALHAVTPLEGMQKAGFDARVSPGIPVFGALPHAEPSMVTDPDGKTSPIPVKVEWFNSATIGENLAHTEQRPNAEYMIKEQWPSYLSKNYCSRMTFTLTPSRSGNHIFSVVSTGRARCLINDEEVFVRDQDPDLVPESFYFFKSKIERRFDYRLEGGQSYRIVLESFATSEHQLQAAPLFGRLFQGSALRFHEEIDVPQLLADASDAAKASDIAVVFVGTTNEIESEGFDRDNMLLPSQQYDLIKAVVAANPRTCVVNFSGAAVDVTPFIDQVPAFVQAAFPGQECGHSVAKVLSGEVNPCGRLPYSWPRRLEDCSSHNNFPVKNGKLRYEEGLDVGYRWHDREEAPDALFAFGSGESYTTFEIEGVRCEPTPKDMETEIKFQVKNTGSVFGKVIVQIYVSGSSEVGRKRPVKELKDFVKVGLEPGGSRECNLLLDKYAVSVYDGQEGCWVAQQGAYKVFVGLSSVDIKAEVDFELAKTVQWRGV
ncbi:glycoside hydrolase superfamily [Elsinoe ampelina]|uniref:beta-glucosidase n=1 Tax=Elsinoe ampelina TaxID=302913 RepID=A0A6A6GB23_9PEZI|nr:glycoside hydrolase superfamily [Elsinoe ampelina]